TPPSTRTSRSFTGPPRLWPASSGPAWMPSWWDATRSRSPVAERRPHVCFFNRSYYPDRGATGQLLTDLAEGLARGHGWRVSVVAGRPLTPGVAGAGGRRLGPVHRETQNGVEIFRAGGTTFAPRRFVGRATNYVTYFLSACMAGFLVPRPDVVVALTDP